MLGRAPKVVGWINLILAGLGYCQLAVNVVGYYSLPASFIGDEGSLMRVRFPTMSIMSAFLLALLGIAGFLLLRNLRNAIAFCTAVFAIEIVAIAVILWRWTMPFIPVSPLMISTGLMNGAIALQIVTLYPVLALVALHLKRSAKVKVAPQ